MSKLNKKDYITNTQIDQIWAAAEVIINGIVASVTDKLELSYFLANGCSARLSMNLTENGTKVCVDTLNN